MTPKKKEKAKEGRPQWNGKDPDIVLQKLEQAWGLDCSDAEAASYADVSPAALSDFLKRNPKVAERKAALKERPVLLARKAVIDAINNGDARTAMQYLERKRRDEFATKTEHVAQIAADIPAVQSAILDPEAQRLADELMRKTGNP